MAPEAPAVARVHAERVIRGVHDAVARLGLDEKGTRINATFRCTPELIGREAEFQTVVKNVTPAQKRAAKRAMEANAAAYA